MDTRNTCSAWSCIFSVGTEVKVQQPPVPKPIEAVPVSTPKVDTNKSFPANFNVGQNAEKATVFDGAGDFSPHEDDLPF